MLDVVLIKLISAGLVRLCQPRDSANIAPTSAPDETFARELVKTEPEAAQRLISQCVSHIWQNCKTVGLPAELAEPHLAALPEMVWQAGLTPADHALFLDPEVDDNETDKLLNLSKRIIATGADLESADGLDETILIYLLEACLTGLHTSAVDLRVIRPSVIRLAAPRIEPEKVEPEPVVDQEPEPDIDLNPAQPTGPKQPESQPDPVASKSAAVTLAKIERADALGITVALLEVITVSLINLTKSSDLRHADLLAKADIARSLRADLQQLPNRSPENASLFEHAANAYASGRLNDCNRMLAAAEDRVVKRSVDTTPHDSDLIDLAVDIRAARAALHTLDGAFMKAARDYGFAQRYVPRTEHERRWQFAELEARYYELAALQHGAEQGLDNAARACTSALATIPLDPPSPLRAEAQTSLARILMLLGEKEHEPARFEIAAQLLADADTSFDDETHVLARLRATTLRAMALTRLGEFHHDLSLLEQAYGYYQSAITTARSVRPSPASTSQETRNIRTLLALNLASHASLKPEQKLADTASEAIREELPDILTQVTPYGQSDLYTRVIAARSHNALATWHTDRGEHELASEQTSLAAELYAAIGFASEAAEKLPSPSDIDAALQGALTDTAANAA